MNCKLSETESKQSVLTAKLEEVLNRESTITVNHILKFNFKNIIKIFF